MRITAIPQLYRNLRRWREILIVLQRYGLADWLSRFRSLPFRNVLKDRSGISLAEYSREQRVRMALNDLGPTFIKLGQILAARPDLVGPKLGDELKRLRVEVRPDDFSLVQQTLAKELGDDYLKHFRSIESTPLATASIGQVHRGTLADGRSVVIKVQRGDIERTMRQDVDILGGLGQLAQRVETLAAWGPVDLVRQLGATMQRELDFQRERQNLEQFTRMLAAQSDQVVVPQPITHLCTRRVLVMTQLCGTPLADLIEISRRTDTNLDDAIADVTVAQSSPTDDSGDADDIVVDATNLAAVKHRCSQSIAAAYLTMLFEAGLFHADPHVGNLIVLTDGRLGILDFGMVGRIDESLRETIAEMLVAVGRGDTALLTRLIRRVGDPPPGLDESALAIDVADFVGNYSQQTLGRFDMIGALNDLSDILHHHAIKLPNQSALLLKMLISLEGTLRELGASFDSLELVHTHLRKTMLRRLSPARRLKQARQIYLEAENFAGVAPDQILQLLQQTRRGELKLVLEHSRIGPTVNRLVLGLMASAVFLGSSLLLALKVPPLLFPDSRFLGISDLSLPGLVGGGGSIAVMLRLLLAINRSGHLNRGNDE